MSKLGKALSKKNIVLVATPKSMYHHFLGDILKRLGARKMHICYVALSKPYMSVKSSLVKTAATFSFIDVLTSAVGETPKCSDCAFVDDPHALTDLGLVLTDTIEKKGCDWFLFDAISAMVVYHPVNVVLMFTHNAINKLRIKETGAVLIIVTEDIEDTFVKDLTMFSDEVLDFTVKPLTI